MVADKNINNLFHNSVEFLHKISIKHENDYIMNMSKQIKS